MAGPRDYTEHVIVQIFRSTLGQPDLSLHTDFFDAGGNSLHAVVVAHRLTKRLGHVVTAAMVYNARTAPRLAAEVRRPAAEGPAELVPLHDPAVVPEDRLPIVMIPGISGDIAYFHGLVAAAPDRQIHGIQPLVLPKPAPDPDWTFEVLGEQYADLLAAQLPGQRVVIAGHSYGGCLALETAGRLAARAGTPDPIVVFVGPPSYEGRGEHTMETLLKEMLSFTAPIGVSAEQAPLRLRELTEGRTAEELRRAVCEEYVRVEWVPEHEADKVVQLQIDYRFANTRALEVYRPEHAYDLDVLLLLSADEPDDPITGTPLEKALPKWRSRRVSGTHSMLFHDPWVAAVGRELAAADRP